MVDWREGKTALECHRYMLEKEFDCDVSFEVGPDGDETEIIRAHKYMLAARSPVFFSMFNGDLQEKGTVRITDVEPGHVRNMLKYVYYEELELTPGNIVKQVTVCDEYLLPGIAAKLEERIDDESACEIWECGEQFDFKEVASKARQHIESSFDDIRESVGFLNLPQELLKTLLSSDDLRVESEEDVFNSCLLWAQNQQNQRQGNASLKEILGECIYAVRFPLMNRATFVRLMKAAPNLLTTEEENVILKYDVTEEAAPFSSDRRW